MSVTDLPVYSPSETEDYLVCPRFRVLKRSWAPNGCAWTPHMLLGTAIHAGLATHYANLEKETLPYESAHAVLEAEFQEGSEWSLDGLRSLVTKGLKAALATELVSANGSVVGVERWVAHSRIDLVTREPFGLVVTDHKVSLDLEKRKLDYKIRDLDPSWQLLQTAWGVQQLFGECPAWSRAHIIAIGPRPFTYVHSIPITPERLADFEKSAVRHWQDMELDNLGQMLGNLPPMNTRSCWRYGRKCEFYDGCHIYAGDLTKFPTLYTPITTEAHAP